jgi:DNA-binding PadR family transcriptional regulator
MRGFHQHHNSKHHEPGQESRAFGPRGPRPRRGGPHGHRREPGDEAFEGPRGPGRRGRPPRPPRHEHDDHEGPGPRGRTRRGEIRTGLLTILLDGPGHGYELIQRVEEKTSGAWKPSPGSVYPTLQLLEDEGLVVAITNEGKRTYDLTEAGRVEAQRRLDSATENPWTRGGGGRAQAGVLFESMKGLAIALKQVAMTGQPEQLEAATEIIKDARKKLYLLLAAD